MDTKTFKRNLQKSENYYRRGFGHQEEVALTMEGEYKSSLIQAIRENGYQITRGI